MEIMILRDIITALDKIFPGSAAEHYDNPGLQVGREKERIKKVLFCLDCTPGAVKTAAEQNCGLIFSHHPLFFKKFRSLKSSDYYGSIAMELVRRGIACYSAHTNFDNMENGLNDYAAEIMGLLEAVPLRSCLNREFYKISVYVPAEYSDRVRDTMAGAGAGKIGNYGSCSFISGGKGSFIPLEGSDPYTGRQGHREVVEEVKVEMACEKRFLRKVCSSAEKAHPYEKPAIDIFRLENSLVSDKCGVVGNLPRSVNTESFLRKLKKLFDIDRLRLCGKAPLKISRVAFAGGSGGGFFNDAAAAGADIFITADIGYHTALEASGRVFTVDAGHFETEYRGLERAASIIAGHPELGKLGKHFYKEKVFYFK